MSSEESTQVEHSVEKLSDTEYLVQVTVPAEQVKRKLEESYRQAVREIELPGFRRGHVPRSLIEARFGADFLAEDVQRELIGQVLPGVLQEAELQPVVPPETETKEFDSGQPFRFSAKLEIFPRPVVADYAGLEVPDLPPQPVSQAEIDDELEELRLHNATLVPKDDPGAKVEIEDMVRVRRPGQGDTYQLQARPEHFSAALLGHLIGDVIRLPLDQMEGPVEIVAIERIERPDLDDLAQTLGHDGATELVAQVRQELEQDHQQAQQAALKRAVLDAVIAKSEVPIPARLVDQLAQAELQRADKQQLEEAELTEFKESIRAQLKRQRVLEAIEEQEELKLSDEEFETYLKEQAQRQQMNPIKFKALLEREGRLEGLRATQNDERALELLLEKAKIIKADDAADEEEQS